MCCAHEVRAVLPPASTLGFCATSALFVRQQTTTFGSRLPRNTCGARFFRIIPIPSSVAERTPLGARMLVDERSSLLHPPSPSSNAPQQDHDDPDPPDKRVLALCVGAVSVTVGLALAMATGLLSPDSLVGLASWFESRGPDAVFLYGLFYFVLELVAVPAIPLTLGSGYLFGVAEGTVVVSIASTLAAAAAFLISRYALRDYFVQMARSYPRFNLMDAAIGREGFKFVFLLRLSPLLPFSISNYLYGLTSVEMAEFVLGSWLGMLPGTIAYVSAGAALSALTDISDGKPSVNKWLLALGVVATIGVLALLGQIASKALEQEGEFSETDMDNTVV